MPSVKPSAAVYPSLVDIAVGISRQPRFAGQGKRWFSVLDHSLFADEMVQRTAQLPFLEMGTTGEARKRWRLAVLLHDAHEAITGDVPTTFKGLELKFEQDKLDVLIGNAFYPVSTEYPAFHHPDVKNAVKWIDRRALAAEARVIGPPVSAERILEAFGVTDDTPDDVQLLDNLVRFRGAEFPVRFFAVPPYEHNPTEHPGVQEYLRRVMELL